MVLDYINLLNKNGFGDNIPMNIDITKVFDPINCHFLLRVLKPFRFSYRFQSWMLLFFAMLMFLFSEMEPRRVTFLVVRVFNKGIYYLLCFLPYPKTISIDNWLLWSVRIRFFIFLLHVAVSLRLIYLLRMMFFFSLKVLLTMFKFSWRCFRS